MDENEIRKRLQDRKLNKVAEGCGLNYTTVCAFMKGSVKPHAGTLAALREYLSR